MDLCLSLFGKLKPFQLKVASLVWRVIKTVPNWLHCLFLKNKELNRATLLSSCASLCCSHAIRAESWRYHPEPKKILPLLAWDSRASKAGASTGHARQTGLSDIFWKCGRTPTNAFPDLVAVKGIIPLRITRWSSPNFHPTSYCPSHETSLWINYIFCPSRVPHFPSLCVSLWREERNCICSRQPS